MQNEIWLPVIGYEGTYEVSNFGQIRSVKRNGRALKQSRCTKGYLFVSLSKNGAIKQILSHRIVAFTFHGGDINDSKKVVCHKNDVRDDNRSENLFIGSALDNVLDSVRKGHGAKGFFKYDKSVIDLARSKKGELSQKETAKLCGISKCYVSLLWSGRGRKSGI
jgi:hypothetical protein